MYKGSETIRQQQKEKRKSGELKYLKNLVPENFLTLANRHRPTDSRH